MSFKLEPKSHISVEACNKCQFILQKLRDMRPFFGLEIYT